MSLLQTPADASHPAIRPGRLDLGYLDGLRAIAALSVVFYHGLHTIWFDGSHTPPHWAAPLSFGNVVPAFLVLSGYCLMLPVVRGNGSLRGGAAAFFRKRARRLLPPYYAGLILSLALDFVLIGRKTGGLWDNTLPVTPRGIGLHLLLLHNFSVRDAHTINYALWSLCVEWWVYFLFPVLVLAWNRFGAGRTAAVSIAVSLLLWQASVYQFHHAFAFHYIAVFVLGMLACELTYSQRPQLQSLRERFPWRGAAWSAFAVLLLAISGKIRHFSSNHVLELLVGLVTFCLLVWMGTRPESLPKRALSHKFLVFLGTFAYSLYLVHAPLLAVIWQSVLVPLRVAPLPAFLLLELVGLPLIVAFAYGFHRVFERPFMSKSSPATEKQAEAAAIVNPAP